MTTIFPNGQVFGSTALTVFEMNALMQGLTTQMLGIGPAAVDFESAVRLDWPTAGQPGYLVTEDVCFVRNLIVDNDYNRIREKAQSYNDGVTVNETWSYTRVWKTSFTIVGPNSSDRARLLKSSLYLDFPADILADSGLYINADIADPVRAPELFDGQWWERVELEVQMNEAVVETIATPTAASGEVIIGDQFGDSAIVNDQSATVAAVIPPSGYGESPFGYQNYGT